MIFSLPPRNPRYIYNIGTLLVPQSGLKGVPRNPVKKLHNVWIEIRDGKIARIGQEGEGKSSAALENTDYDAQSGLVTPGLVDAHTHPVFTATRQAEFVRRCRGETYQQIASTGGGILSSLRGVRKASEAELRDHITRHLDRFIELGVTTIEGKSGYGLSVEDELKSLRSLKAAAEHHPVDVSPTLLAAHVIPPEFKNNPDSYVDLITKKIIPESVRENIAEGIDVFLEKGAYTMPQARRVLKSGADAGLMVHIHADQFSAGGGAELAAEFNAATADHMDRTGKDGIAVLADAAITVVLLPGAVFFLGMSEYAPGRQMIDAGCTVAVSTDFNPGSSPTQSLPLMMTLACIYMGLTPGEALWATTSGAAKAIRREGKIGSLEPGYYADICIWNCENVDLIPYKYGDMIPEAVFKRGHLEVIKGIRIGGVDFDQR